MKFYCLSRDRGEFYLIDLKADSKEEVNEYVNDVISTNTSQDWILTEKEYCELKDLINNTK
jgi:hypothetical protein